MRLFKVSFADEVHVVVALYPEDAIYKVQLKTDIDFLPYTAEPVDIPGYKIVEDIPNSELISRLKEPIDIDRPIIEEALKNKPAPQKGGNFIGKKG